MIEYPNKVYVSQWKGDNPFGGKSHFSIVTAGSDPETVRDYVREQIGIDVEPVWLMNVVYPTIWLSDGSKPMIPQVKILHNSNFHTSNKDT